MLMDKLKNENGKTNSLKFAVEKDSHKKGSEYALTCTKIVLSEDCWLF